MKPLRWVVLCSGVGVMFVAGTFLNRGAWAYDNDEHEQMNLQNNPKIKCMPQGRQNVQRQNLPRQIVPILESQHHKGCAACHQSTNPVAGRGDHPRVNAATALVENTLDHTIQYDLKIGNSEWKSYDLKPGTYHRLTWNYGRKKGKSPQYQMRYGAEGSKQQKNLLLVATPNKNLGNLYYFSKNKRTQEVELKTPKKKLYRKRRR